MEATEDPDYSIENHRSNVLGQVGMTPSRSPVQHKRASSEVPDIEMTKLVNKFKGHVAGGEKLVRKPKPPEKPKTSSVSMLASISEVEDESVDYGQELEDGMLPIGVLNLS